MGPDMDVMHKGAWAFRTEERLPIKEAAAKSQNRYPMVFIELSYIFRANRKPKYVRDQV